MQAPQTKNKQKNRSLEQWVPWHPLPNLEAKYSLHSIRYTHGGLVLLFTHYQQPGTLLKFEFLQSVISFNIWQESVCFKIVDTANHASSDEKPLYTQWTFFTVNNSRLLNTQNTTATHFVYAEMDTIIEIVGTSHPVCSEVLQ